MSLFTVEPGRVIVDSPAYLTIRSFKPIAPPVVQGATLWAQWSGSHREMVSPASLIPCSTRLDPPRDDAAWADFIAGNITHTEWQQRQAAFCGSPAGWGYGFNESDGSKRYLTDKSECLRRTAAGQYPGYFDKIAEVWKEVTDHWYWHGCCVNNGGNYTELPGNPIVVIVPDGGVFQLIAKNAGTWLDEEIWVGSSGTLSDHRQQHGLPPEDAVPYGAPRAGLIVTPSSASAGGLPKTE